MTDDVVSLQTQKGTDMGLRFVVGSDSAAVTSKIYECMLSETTMKQGERCIYFVPEQATLGAQKDLSALHKNGCVMQIDILPLKRLAYRLLEEFGDILPVVLDDIGKGMVLKKVLTDKEKELEIYRGKASKSGFVQEIKSLVSEFASYSITGEHLDELSQKVEDPYVARKLRDFSVIMNGFRETLAEEYITEEDIFSALCPLVLRSERLKGSRLYFDGFTGFTPTQYELLRSLMCQCKEITVGITMEPECFHQVLSESHLFTMSAKMVASVESLAGETGHSVGAPIFVEEKQGEASLLHLQKQLFRYPVVTYPEEPEITVHSLASRRDEVAYVVGNIVRFVQKHGYRYGELGIVCGDVEGYREELLTAFVQAKVPFFVDYKSDVMDNPLVDYIRSLLRILVTDFRKDVVLHFLKNPLGEYDTNTVSYLENYLLAKGVRGYSWWKKGFRGRYATGHFCKEDEVRAFAKQLLEELEPLQQGFQGNVTVRERVVLLYAFIQSHELYGRMERRADRLQDVSVSWSRRREKEYRQIYQSVMELFDRLVGLLGDVSMTTEEFSEVLDAGLAELKLGTIPPEQDCVIVGDVKRSRLSGIRHLFFLGVNEGVVPGGAGGSELLTQKERELLKDRHQMELSQTKWESISTEEFYLYLAFSKPTEHLTLTYARASEEGEEYRPSYVIYRILNLFPKLNVSNEHLSRDFFDRIAADGGTKEFLRGFAGGTATTEEPEIQELCGWFSEHPEAWSLAVSMEELVRAREDEESQDKLDTKLAQALYSQCLHGSVSRLECYAACAYQHFLKYGLRLEERPEYRVSPFDVGNAFHDALKRYSEKVKQSDYTFRQIPAEVMTKYMDEAVEEMLEDPEREQFGASQRNAFLSVTMRNTLQNMADIITRQEKSGNFEPELFEQNFRYTSEYLDLRGIIDRVDIASQGNETYFKIVDYKSSEHKVDLDRVKAGLDIQLLAYAGAFARKNTYNAKPAALFYQEISDPLVEECDAPQDEVLRQLRPNGLVRREEKLLHMLDNQIDSESGGYKSSVIPVTLRKDGEPDAKSIKHVLDGEQMDQLIADTEALMEQEAREIMGGEIGKQPYRYGKEVACDRCDYNGICGKELRSRRKERVIGAMATDEKREGGE